MARRTSENDRIRNEGLVKQGKPAADKSQRTDFPLLQPRDFKPVTFLMHCAEDRNAIMDFVVRNGGNVVKPTDKGRFRDASTTITLSHPLASFMPQGVDVFDVKYIHDCEKEGALLPNLKDYRLNATSVYKEDYDPFRVLLGELTFPQLTLLKIRSEEEEGQVCSGIEDFDEENRPSNMVKVSSNRLPVAHRAPYTLKEEQFAVDFLVKKKAYGAIRGNRIWKEMAAETATQRSWQSLKEHFLKCVSKKLHRFQSLDEKKLTRFQRAMKNLNVIVTSSSEENEELAVAAPAQSDAPELEQPDSSTRSPQIAEPTADPDVSGELIGDSESPLLLSHDDSSAEEADVSGNDQIGGNSSSWSSEPSSDADDDDDEWEKSRSELRSEYSKAEDLEILNYLIKTRTCGEVKGNRVWEVMANRLKGKRSWQSLKNRFLRVISKNLPSYELSEDVLNRFVAATAAAAATARPKPVAKAQQSNGGGGKEPERRERPPVVALKRRKLYSKRTLDLFCETPKRSPEKFAEATPQEKSPGTSRDPPVPVCRRRQEYSREEDIQILQFIVKHKRFAHIKGNVLWEDMVRSNVCPGRSSQSLKERFRKRIVRNIDSFHALFTTNDFKLIKPS